MDALGGAYDAKADLTFDARVFNPIKLNNLTVLNTRRIAFDHYQNSGVEIMEPIQFPSVQTCTANQRTVQSMLKLIQGIIITCLTLPNCFPDQLKLCNDTYIASQNVAVYPEDKGKFEMTDAPPNNSASSGKLSVDLAGVLIMGIIPAATLLVHLARGQHH